MQAIDILRAKGNRVVTIEPHATLGELVRLLTWEGVGSAVVIDEGKVCGIITERDVLRAIADHGQNALTLPVHQRMTFRVLSCAPVDPIEEILEVMTTRRIRHVPVMEGDTLAGVISIGDAVKAQLEEAKTEAHVLREYVTAH